MPSIYKKLKSFYQYVTGKEDLKEEDGDDQAQLKPGDQEIGPDREQEQSPKKVLVERDYVKK